MFRFKLSHDALGEKYISAPSGWNEAVMRLDRHEEYHSLFEMFEGEFIFYGSDGIADGGVEFIREVEQTYGPDTTLNIDIDYYTDSIFDNVFSGQLALDLLREMPNNTMMVPIIRNDFTAIFTNRVETPVDIMSTTSLDGDPVDQFDNINLETTPQIINKVTTYLGSIIDTGFVTPEFVMPVPALIDASGVLDDFTTHTQEQSIMEQDEIIQSFDPLWDFVSDPDDITPPIELLDESGEITISIRNSFAFFNFAGIITTLSSETDPSTITSIQIRGQHFYQINDDAAIALGGTFGLSQSGPPNPALIGVPTAFSRNFSFSIPNRDLIVNLDKNDRIKIYIKWEILIVIDVGADTGSIQWNQRILRAFNFGSDTTFSMKSTFAVTNTESFLVHDVAGQVLDRIINRDGTFYSEHLGSGETKYRQYDQDGCGWKYALARGLQIRQYPLSEKPFSISFKDWWNGLSPILNLGMGYEIVDGVEVMRCEQRDYFYDPSISVNLSNVSSIVRSQDNDIVYKTVKVGYKAWQSEDISGIDDPQTKHTYVSPLRKMGTELIIESDFIAASLAWEATRRQTRKKSADYKFDDNTFIVAIRPTETSPANTYLPELDENFSTILHLLNPETRYNTRLTPARNAIRHLNIIAGGLYPHYNTALKFTKGEGNSAVTSVLEPGDCDYFLQPISENNNIPIGSSFIHLAQAYEVTTKMTWEEYREIRNNRRNAIGISQTEEGHKPFFIKALGYELSKAEANFIAWPLEFFQVTTVDIVRKLDGCFVSDDCLDAYLTQNSFEFETEDGECLIIEGGVLEDCADSILTENSEDIETESGECLILEA